jgi:RNA polymerase sigma factor FliA
VAGKRDDNVVAITKAIRANRVARLQGQDGGASQESTTTMVEAEAPAEAGKQLRPEQAEMVEEHLWLVDRLASQAARRFPRYVERNELWSAGVLGLVEAARRFDPNYGVPFASFASARVRGEMLEAVRAGDMAPRRLRRSLRELAAVVDELTQELGRVPNLTEVAQAANIDVDLVRTRMSTAASLIPSSLDDDDSPASERALASLHTEPSERLSQQELLGAIREAVVELPEPLKSILIRTQWGGEKLIDLGEELGISAQRVAQYRVEAITALAAWFATLYEAVPMPDQSLPGTVRRAAFCAALSSNSSWQARLDKGASAFFDPSTDAAVERVPEPALDAPLD